LSFFSISLRKSPVRRASPCRSWTRAAVPRPVLATTPAPHAVATSQHVLCIRFNKDFSLQNGGWVSDWRFYTGFSCTPCFHADCFHGPAQILLQLYRSKLSEKYTVYAYAPPASRVRVSRVVFASPTRPPPPPSTTRAATPTMLHASLSFGSICNYRSVFRGEVQS
jgi:hypothetical protein